MKKCKYCGHDLEDKVTFCGFCGQKSVEPAEFDHQSENSKKRNIGILTVSLILILLTISGVGIYLCQYSIGSIEEPYTIGNNALSPLGFSGIKSDGEYIYYTNYTIPYIDMENPNYDYQDGEYVTDFRRMDLKGGNDELLFSSEPLHFSPRFEIIGNRLFVRKYSGEYDVFNKQGKKQRSYNYVIATEPIYIEEYPSHIQMVDDEIYFNIHSINGYKSKLKKNEVIVDAIAEIGGADGEYDIDSVYYYDGYVYLSFSNTIRTFYYEDDSYFYNGAVGFESDSFTVRVNMTTGEYNLIFYDSVDYLMVYDDKMYYVDNDGYLERCRLDGSQVETLANCLENQYYIYDDYIYFTYTDEYSSDDYEINEVFRIDIDGESIENIAHNSKLLGIAEDWMLCYNFDTRSTEIVRLPSIPE